MKEVSRFLLGEVIRQGWPKATKKPVALTVVFVCTRAKSNKTKLHTQKPDLSNFIKLLEDAANGVLYHDDSQIVSIAAHKVWGVPARTVFKLQTIES